jgi:hypothetical protein
LGPWAKANYCRAVIKSPRGTVPLDAMKPTIAFIKSFNLYYLYILYISEKVGGGKENDFLVILVSEF